MKPLPLSTLLTRLLRRLRESMPAFKRRSDAARLGWARRKARLLTPKA